MPAERKQLFRLDLLDPYFDLFAFVRLLLGRHVRIHFGGPDRPAHLFPRRESAVELHPKPGSKFIRVADRPPDPGPRRAQQNLLLNSIRMGRIHVQPPGCRLARARKKCNHKVA